MSASFPGGKVPLQIQPMGERLGVRFKVCTCPSSKECDRRKPQPGMLLCLMRRFNVSAAEPLYVVDLEKDREAVERAGVRSMSAWDFFSELQYT